MYLIRRQLIRLVFFKLGAIELRLLGGGILVVPHGHVVVGGPWEELRLHVHILVGCVRVLHEGVTRRVLQNEGEGEATPIHKLLNLLDELVDLGCRRWIVLSAILLEVREPLDSLGKEAFHGVHRALLSLRRDFQVELGDLDNGVL